MSVPRRAPAPGSSFTRASQTWFPSRAEEAPPIANEQVQRARSRSPGGSIASARMVTDFAASYAAMPRRVNRVTRARRQLAGLVAQVQLEIRSPTGPGRRRCALRWLAEPLALLPDGVVSLEARGCIHRARNRGRRRCSRRAGRTAAGRVAVADGARLLVTGLSLLEIVEARVGHRHVAQRRRDVLRLAQLRELLVGAAIKSDRFVEAVLPVADVPDIAVEARQPQPVPVALEDPRALPAPTPALRRSARPR